MLLRFSGATMFSVMVLARGFHQVPIAPEDREETAFSTPEGHCEFVEMPFMLSVAPPTYQRMVNDETEDMRDSEVLEHPIDDFLIPAKTLDQHNRRLTKFLEKLREANFNLQPEKCKFFCNEVTFLGHIISP